MDVSDERTILTQVAQQLAAHRDELAAQLQEALETTMFSNRSFIRPAHLKRIAAQEATNFLSFLQDGDLAPIRDQGATRAKEGLGEAGVLRLSTVLRRFCLTHLAGELLRAGLEAADAYADAFLEDFMAAREAIILDEQERIRAALQHSLGRYTLQLQTAAEIAQAASSILDLDELLCTSADLIRQRFDLYYVGIFLVDEYGEWATLRAGTGEPGREMLRQGHKLEIGGKSMIGQCTAHGQARIALDVGQEAVRFDNPLLPETRSELALPLISRGRVIGALTIQSRHTAAFGDEDITILRTLAGQLANAIENAHLFAEAQARTEELETIHRRYLRGEWSRLQAGQETRRPVGYAYEHSMDALFPLDDVWRPEIEQAIQRAQVVAWTDDDAAPPMRAIVGEAERPFPPPRAALAAPLTLRGETIGALGLYEVEEERRWTEDDIALVEAISDQVALALENARLFTDAQRRAEQMAILNRIGLDLTSGLELESVLQALYEQCRQVLVTDTFYVALHDEASGLVEFPLLTGVDGPLHIEPLDIRQQPGFTGYVIQTGQVLHVPDTHAIPADAPYHALPISDLPNRSYLGVPLTIRGRVIGVLSIQSYQPHTYTDEDIELLTTIAAQASIAIENARAYERLVETTEQLREMDRLKTQFLANMSHELRTPLNSIIGFSRVMLKGIDGPLTELQEADLTSIYNSGQHLLGLINDILDMSKIEAGKMDLSFEEVFLPDIFTGVMSTAKALVKDRPIALRTNVPDDLPTVWADAQRVRQVLINFLSNAAKFTEEGYITLEAQADAEFVTISVSDTGIGIPPEAQRRLFIPFQQVDGSTTRRAEGTGLGLAISRSFIEMHGGEIWVESEPGQGATFFCTLPIYQAIREREQQEAEIDLVPGKKVVLAVDDDQGVITLLKRYLETDGYQVIGVLEPHRALEMAQRLAPNLTAITLDVVMPNMDGWQVLRALKQTPQTRDIPVILCSIVESVNQGLSLGAAACLQKPVTRDEVLDALRKVERHA